MRGVKLWPTDHTIGNTDSSFLHAGVYTSSGRWSGSKTFVVGPASCLMGDLVLCVGQWFSALFLAVAVAISYPCAALGRCAVTLMHLSGAGWPYSWFLTIYGCNWRPRLVWGDVRQFEYSLITGGVCRVLCLPILYTPYFWGLGGLAA